MDDKPSPIIRNFFCGRFFMRVPVFNITGDIVFFLDQMTVMSPRLILLILFYDTGDGQDPYAEKSQCYDYITHNF